MTKTITFTELEKKRKECTIYKNHAETIVIRLSKELNSLILQDKVLKFTIESTTLINLLFEQLESKNILIDTFIKSYEIKNINKQLKLKKQEQMGEI